MNIANEIDIFFMKMFVRPIVNGIEKWTGLVPSTLAFFIIMAGFIATPFMMVPSMIEASRYFGGTGGENIAVLIITVFNLFYLKNIDNKATARWRLYLDRSLHTIGDTGIVYDPARWKWFLMHMLVAAGVLALPRFGALTFPLIPTWFFWPALAICGVRPYYGTTRIEQGARSFKVAGTFACALFAIASLFYLRVSNDPLNAKMLVIFSLAILTKLLFKRSFGNSPKRE